MSINRTINKINYCDPLKYRDKYLSSPINKKALYQVKRTFKKQVLSLIEGFNNCIFNDINTILKALNDTFNKIFDSLKTNKDLINLFNFNDNSKINIGINYKPYLLCLNMHKGQEACNLCFKCYSNKQELAYKIDSQGHKNYYSLINTLKNFILFYYCIFNKSYNLIYKGLKKSLKFNSPYFKTYSLNRFNIKADIDSQEILSLFNSIHIFLKRLYKNPSFKSYTYTKNKELSFKDLDKDFIISQSYGLRDMDYIKSHYKDINYNSFITVNKEDLTRQDIKFLVKNTNICSVSRGLTNKCINCQVACYNVNKDKPVNICYLH